MELFFRLLPTLIALGTNKRVIDAVLGRGNLLDLLSPEIRDLLRQFGATIAPEVSPDVQTNIGGLAIFGPDHVRWIQQGLNELMGSDLEVDGSYGPATKEAVREFQKQEGLVVDGWAGRNTTEALRKKL